MEFENKTVLVSGGSRGIGRAIAEAFAGKGAGVALLYAGNEAAAEEAAAACRKKGAKALCLRCDVGDYAAAGAAAKEVLEAFGGVDVLVNNAGIAKDGLLYSMKEEQWDEVLRVDLKGAFNLTKHLCGHFIKKRAGRILNITSVVGLAGNAGQANYAAAKAGLIGLTKSTAKELAPRGVTCNALAPGFIDTEMTAAIPEKKRKGILDAIPARRPGTPAEVAALCVFLAGEGAGYINGEVIRVDGGMAM